MDHAENARIFIVDDEEQICRTLTRLIGSWGMRVDSTTHPGAVSAEKIGDLYDVFLLDIQMPEMSGFDLIPQIKLHCPDAKIIMMTGYADKDTAIKALQLGAFDFLEKPFQSEIIYYTISRALNAIEKERELRKSYEELQLSQAELMAHKEGLEYLNSQLVETNKALALLARNFEREREDVEKKIALKLKTVIGPIVDKLRKLKGSNSFETELGMLVRMIEDLTSNFHADARIASTLSFTELRIASMIRSGVSTEEIARQLGISTSTVRTHRKNIRKKLNINNVRYSLRNFLSSGSESDASAD